MPPFVEEVRESYGAEGTMPASVDELREILTRGRALSLFDPKAEQDRRNWAAWVDLTLEERPGYHTAKVAGRGVDPSGIQDRLRAVEELVRLVEAERERP